MELAENGVDGFSMRSVARRAGVARPTVTARWPDRDVLILEALDDTSGLPEFESAHDVRADLLALLDQTAAILESPVMRLQQRLAADSDRYPELFARFQDKVMRTAAQRFETVIEAAAKRGELAAGVDRALFADSLVGVMLVRTFASGRQRPPGPDARRRLVESMLCLFGCRPE